jgi:hypothetical protein
MEGSRGIMRTLGYEDVLSICYGKNKDPRFWSPFICSLFYIKEPQFLEDWHDLDGHGGPAKEAKVNIPAEQMRASEGQSDGTGNGIYKPFFLSAFQIPPKWFMAYQPKPVVRFIDGKWAHTGFEIYCQEYEFGSMVGPEDIHFPAVDGKRASEALQYVLGCIGAGAKDEALRQLGILLDAADMSATLVKACQSFEKAMEAVSNVIRLWTGPISKASAADASDAV